MPHSLPPAVVLCRMAACALLALSTSSHAQDVPVPQQTYTTAQLYQPLRTFTTAEIGILPTQVGIHHGYMVVSGGRQGGTGGDPTGYGKLTIWRLSQPSAPNTVNPSLVGQILDDNIYKSHVMGFSGEKVALRTNKFTIFDLTNPTAPTALGTGSGGKSSSHSSCWAGKYIYTCGEGYGTASGWLDIYDVSNPNSPTLVRSVDLPTITGFRCASVFILGNQLIVSASLTNGVAAFDLSDPTNPLLVSVFRGDTGANTYTSYLSGYRLYGGGQAGGLYIYDVSDSENIKLVDHVTALGGTPRYPVLQDEFLHIANLGNGHYQKLRIDTVPAQIVADVPMPIPAGANKADTEIAIPIGNLVYVGCINGANPGTPITNPAGWIIPHDTVPDTRPPAVNGVRPLDGETNVAPTSMIGVSFTDLLNTPSISNSSIIVRPVGGAALAGTYSNMGGIVNFAPSTPLAANTTYEVVVKGGGVQDYSGNAFAADQISRFSTGSSIDTTTLGLALYYPLDEASGTTADDTLGAHNGTLTNFPATPWSAGIVGAGSLTFDGVASYVAVPSLDVGSAFSFSTWVRVNSGSSNLETIVANAAGGFATAGFRLFVYGSAHASYPGRVQLETGDGTTGNAANTAIGALPFDQWVHLAVTVDRTAGAAHIYINGIDQTADGSVLTDFPTAAALTLGRMGTASYFFGGGMDDFRLYSRVLAAADINQLRNLCVSPIGHWGFNNTTADAAPNGRPITLSATGNSYDATQANEGGWSLNLDGSTGYATTPSLELGNSFTLAAWVRIPSGNSGLNTIIANGPSGYIGNGFNFYVTGSTNATPGKIQFETGNGTVGNDAHTAANAFPFDQWVHVAVGVDRARGTALIYVNGKDVTADNTIRTDFKTAGTMDAGRMTNSSNYLTGNIDDLRVYPRWLSDNEIATLAIGKLLAYWSFDGTGNDDSGFGRTATLMNGAGYSTVAVRGSESLNLDGIDNGSDDHAEVSAFDLGNQFSISLWAKLTTTVASSRTLLANSAGGSTTNGMRFFLNSWNTDDGRIIFETGNGTLSGTAGSAPGVFQPNQWNHIAVVVDRTAGHADLYYNRQLVTSVSTIRPDFATNALLYIGRLVTSANFNGQIDDFRIYAKKLTTDDVGALGAGSPNTPPTVSNLASSASAATTSTGLTFTATASDPNFGDTLTYRFDFGDGTTTAWTSNNTAVHTYNTPGRYSVTVFVSDGTATITRTMTQIVYNAPTSLPPSISAEMAYDTSRNKVWCVVPDGDGAAPAGGRVVRFDANTRAVDYRVALGANTDPVALALRPGNAEVWVACKESDQVIVVDANLGTVLATLTIGHGYEPTGVAFAPDGSAAFVTCEGSETIQKWDPNARTKTLEFDLGGSPRGLAVASDSSRIFVSHFRSPDTQGEVWELAAAGLTLTRTFALPLDTTTPDSASSARGLPNYLSQVVVSPDGQRAWLPGKKDNILRGKYRDGLDLTHDDTVRTLIAQLNLTTSSPNPNAEIVANRVDLDNTGLPVSACFSPHGDLLFVAIIANEEVAVIDANTRATQPAISTADAGKVLGYAPSGLCVSPDGTKLFVHNFLERTVRVYDISQLTGGTGSTASLLGTVPLVVTEPLTVAVLQGKKIFYNSEDPRIAAEGYISCVSCHLHGDSDGRVWDLGTFGEGLRKTIDLRGHAGMSMGPLHWSANFDEVQDFENQIRNLNGGAGLISNGTPNPPLGPPNAGRSVDLDDLAAFVTSLSTIPKSPYRNPDGTNTTSAINGQASFNALNCANCHSGTEFTDSSLTTFVRHDMGTINTSSGGRLGVVPLDGIDTPTLRGIWGTYPYLHRGQAADLPSVFNTTNAPAGKGHDVFRTLTPAQQTDLIRYLLELE